MEIQWEYESYPLVICYVAIENGHRNSWFTLLKNVIFHGYVSLPEGKRERKGLEDTGNYGEHMVNKGNHPQMALIQVSEIL